MEATQWMMRRSPFMRCIISESEAASSLNQMGQSSMHTMEVITLSSAFSGLIWDWGAGCWTVGGTAAGSACAGGGAPGLSGSGLDGHLLLLSHRRQLTTGAPCRCGGWGGAGWRRSGYCFLRGGAASCNWNTPSCYCSRSCDGDGLHGLSHRQLYYDVNHKCDLYISLLL